MSRDDGGGDDRRDAENDVGEDDSGLPAPAPDQSPETAAFWEATADDRLLVRSCADCGAAFHPPRAICPECHSDATEWIEAGGRGTVYTYSVMRQNHGPFGEAVPYVLAYVELEEGPRLLTNVVGVDVEDVEVGQEVRVTFEDTGDGTKLPRFTPV